MSGMVVEQPRARGEEKLKAKSQKLRADFLEPTIGIEPMTCRLRIDCSTS
jgi:hypothetical protein